MTQPQISFLVLPGVWPCQVPPAETLIWWWVDPELSSARSFPPRSWTAKPSSGPRNLVSMFPSLVGQVFWTLNFWFLLQFEGSLSKFCLINTFVTIWVFSTICVVTIWVCHNLSFVIIGVFVTIWVITPKKIPLSFLPIFFHY